jgi:hypothetical protein
MFNWENIQISLIGRLLSSRWNSIFNCKNSVGETYSVVRNRLLLLARITAHCITLRLVTHRPTGEPTVEQALSDSHSQCLNESMHVYLCYIKSGAGRSIIRDAAEVQVGLYYGPGASWYWKTNCYAGFTSMIQRLRAVQHTVLTKR